MKTLLAALFIALLTIPGVAAADAVTEWSEIALATATAGKHGAAEASRTTALVHAAIFDAVNAIAARYTPYKVTVTAPTGASTEAAAVAAAHAPLVRLYPDQKTALDQALAKSLGRHPPQGGPGSCCRTPVSSRSRRWRRSRISPGFIASPPTAPRPGPMGCSTWSTRIPSPMMASASRCFSFQALVRRRRASSAAVKMVNRSSWVGVKRMDASP